MDLQSVPDRWLSFYLALLFVLFIGCVMIAKLVAASSQIWHDILLVIAGLMLAGVFSIAAVKRVKAQLPPEDED